MDAPIKVPATASENQCASPFARRRKTSQVKCRTGGTSLLKQPLEAFYKFVEIYFMSNGRVCMAFY